MTYEEALDYLNTYGWSQWKLGLDRITELTDALGRPQDDLRFIHVAGSNGKGSFTAMMESVLRAEGYVTGMFPSPYIEDFRERIQVCGEYISKEALTRLTEQVSRAADAMEEHPTHFELITAIGLLYFKEMKCDIVVLEVGLGGEFDSTNIIDPPELAVITHIGLDHTEYLGESLTEIAKAKAGIIKSGSPVVCMENDDEVLKVISESCGIKGCRLEISKRSDITPLSHDLERQCFSYKGKAYDLGLLGDYQLENAALVLKAVEVLRDKGLKISDEALEAGLRDVRWPARFEVLKKDPVFILDGGHNPQCAEALYESLQNYFAGERFIFIVGVMADKDHEQILRILMPLAHEIICVTPDNARALNASSLMAEAYEISRDMGIPVRLCGAESIKDAIEIAFEKADETGHAIVAFGSLYMAGDIRKNVV